MPARLVAVSGPLAGQSYALGPGALSLGRGEHCAVQIRDLAVSRDHCRLEPLEDGVLLRDLGSRHGTLVNGTRVSEHRLAAGDKIDLGGSAFVFEPGDDTPILFDDTLAVHETATFRAATGDESPSPPGRSTPAAEDLAALIQAGQILNRLRAPEPLAARLLALATQAIPAERAALLLLDPGTAEPHRVFSLDRVSGGTAPFPVSRTVVQRALAERRSVLSNEVLLAPGLADAASLQASRVQALLCAPLPGPDRPLGVLYLDTQSRTTVFTPQHLEWVSGLCTLAAIALANALHIERLAAEARRLDTAAGSGIVGQSGPILAAERLLTRVARTDSTVLLRGESGTGKELAARSLHAASRRAAGPFVAINCATLSETLLESELFGHEKGAFTGAVAKKIGKLEMAEGGTVFLDEIGEVPLGLQAKLLRAIQEREFERVGGTRPVQVDVRLVAATHRDLEKAIREGGFREDLYYRLNVIAVTLPPLRDRKGDIPLLADHFVRLFARRIGRPVSGLTPAALACLARYPWPGNVRELANAIERAVVLGEGDEIHPEDLPESLLESAPATPGGPIPLFHDELNRTKRRLIADALERAGGNVTRAAESLGLHPNYLHRLIRNLGLREGSKG